MWILCLFWMKGKLDIFLARFAESGYNERQDIQKGETEMISKQMEKLVQGSSVIRAMFEAGKKLAEKYGAENVYDFSLGNPSVEPPEEVKQAMMDVIREEDPGTLHGYMSNSGFEDVRDQIAGHLNRNFDTHFTRDHIVMTVGAAGGLNVILKTLLDPGDEFFQVRHKGAGIWWNHYHSAACICHIIVIFSKKWSKDDDLITGIEKGF